MSCRAPEQLAAAATEGDDAILAHALTCSACLHALDDQRGLRALVQRAPAVVLTRERREAMAAELLAKADQLPAAAPVLSRERRDAMAAELMTQADQLDASVLANRRANRRRTAALVVAGLAAAAAMVVFVAARGEGSKRAPRTEVAATGSAMVEAEAPRGTSEAARVVEPPPASAPTATEPPTTGSAGAQIATTGESPTTGTRPTPASAKLAGTGDYARDERDARASRDVVRLRGGELTVDSTGSRPVEIVSGGTAIAVTKARVKVIATRGVVSSVAVFAGTAQVTIDGHSVIVEAGTVWERDVARDDALAAFKTGWTALRAGDHAAAIAAFDLATDPIVAEDAAYWSAIASERAADSAGAVRRYRELLERFPSTTRAAEARAAIARLAP